MIQLSRVLAACALMSMITVPAVAAETCDQQAYKILKDANQECKTKHGDDVSKGEPDKHGQTPLVRCKAEAKKKYEEAKKKCK